MFICFFAGSFAWAAEGEKKKGPCEGHKPGEGSEYTALNQSKQKCETFGEVLQGTKEEVNKIKAKLNTSGQKFDSYSGSATDAKASIEASKAMAQKSISELEAGKKSLDTVAGNVGKVQEYSSNVHGALVSAEAKLNTEKARLEKAIQDNTKRLNEFEARINAARSNTSNVSAAQLSLQQLQPPYDQLKKATDDLKERHKKTAKAAADYPGGRADQKALTAGAEKLGGEIKAEKAKIDTGISGLKEQLAKLEKVKLGEANEGEKTAENKKSDESKTPKERQAEADSKAMEGMSGNASMDPVKAKASEETAKKQTAESSGSPEAARSSSKAEQDLLAAGKDSKGSEAFEAGVERGKSKGEYLPGNEGSKGAQVFEEQVTASQETKDQYNKEIKERDGASGVSKDMQEHIKGINEIDKKLEAAGSFDKKNTPAEVSELIEQRKLLTDSIAAQPSLAAEGRELGIKERTLGNASDDTKTGKYGVTYGDMPEQYEVSAPTHQEFTKTTGSDEALKKVSDPGYAATVEKNITDTNKDMDKKIIQNTATLDEYKSNVKNASKDAMIANARINAEGGGMSIFGGGAPEVTAKDMENRALGSIAAEQNVGAGAAGIRQNSDDKKAEFASAIKSANASEKVTDAGMMAASVIPGASVYDYMRADAAVDVAKSDMYASGFNRKVSDVVTEREGERTMAAVGVGADVVGGSVLSVGGKAVGAGVKGLDNFAAKAAGSTVVDVATSAPAVQVAEAAVRSAPTSSFSHSASEVASHVPTSFANSAAGSADNVAGATRVMQLPEKSGAAAVRLESPSSRETARLLDAPASSTYEAAVPTARMIDPPPPSRLITEAEESADNIAAAPVRNGAGAATEVAPPPTARRIEPETLEVARDAPAEISRATGRTAAQDADNVVALPSRNVSKKEGSAVLARNDSGDNVIDFSGRRSTPEPKRTAEAPRSNASNDNLPWTEPVAVRKVANGGWDSAESAGEAAGYTGGLAKAFGSAADSGGSTAAKQAPATGRMITASAPTVVSPSVVRAAASAPMPSSSVGRGISAAAPAPTYSGRAISSEARSASSVGSSGAADASAEAARARALAKVQQASGLDEAGARGLLNQPSHAMAKNEITTNPALQNLSRTQRNDLTNIVDSGRNEIQAARGGASSKPSAAVPSSPSTGRSLASTADNAAESGAGREASRRPMAASAEDDGSYDAFGSGARADSPARRTAYSPSRASRSEDAVSDVARQADESLPVAAKAADDASPSASAAVAETPKPPAKLTTEQEAFAKKAGVDPKLNDLLANPKDYTEGREAFYKAMGAEPGSAKRAELNNGGEYNRFLGKQKEYESLNVAAAEKAAAKEQRDAAIAAINAREAGKPSEVAYLKLDRSGMVEGPNPFASTKARDAAERYVGADKVKELKQLHLADQARSADLPLSKSRYDVGNYVKGKNGAEDSLATTSLKGRLERYEQALADAANNAEKKFAKEGMPSPKGLVPDEAPRLSQLDSVVPSREQAALRSKNGVPEKYNDVADLGYEDVRLKVYDEEAKAYRKDIASLYGEKNVEKHFDDVTLSRRQGEAMSEVYPKVKGFQDDLAKADAAIVGKRADRPTSAASSPVAPPPARAPSAAKAENMAESAPSGPGPVRSAPSPAPVEKTIAKEVREVEGVSAPRSQAKSIDEAPRGTGASLSDAPASVGGKLTKEQEVFAKKAGVDPKLNDLLANPKDFVEGREAFYKAMGAEPGSAERRALSNSGSYEKFLGKQKEFESFNVAAAEKAAAKEQRDAAIAAINAREAGKPSEVAYLKLDRSGMVEGPNPFASTKARDAAERYVGADKVSELKKIHLMDQARASDLPLSKSRYDVGNYVKGKNGAEDSLATTSLKGRLERYEQALADAANDAEKKFAKEGMPAPKGLVPEETPRLTQLESAVPSREQAALRSKNGVPEKYSDVADLGYEDVRLKVYDEEAEAYRKDIASLYGEKNVEKHFDDVTLSRRQGEAMSEVYPKIKNYQADLGKADSAITKAVKEADEAAPLAEKKAEALLAKGAKDADAPVVVKNPLDEVIAHEAKALDEIAEVGAKGKKADKVEESLARSERGEPLNAEDALRAEKMIDARALKEVDPNISPAKLRRVNEMRAEIDGLQNDLRNVGDRLKADPSNIGIKSEILKVSEDYAKKQREMMEELGFHNHRLALNDADNWGGNAIPARWVLESAGTEGVTANRALTNVMKNSEGRIGMRIDPVGNHFFGSAAHFDPNDGMVVMNKIASKTSRIESDNTLLHEIGHAVRWDKDQQFAKALDNNLVSHQDLQRMRSKSNFRSYASANDGESLRTTTMGYNRGHSMDEAREAAFQAKRETRQARERDFIANAKGEEAIPSELNGASFSKAEGLEARAYAMADATENSLSTLQTKMDGAKLISRPDGSQALRFTDGSEHVAETIGKRMEVEVPLYRDGKVVGTWKVEASNPGRGVWDTEKALKREVDQSLAESRAIKNQVTQGSPEREAFLQKKVDRRLAFEDEVTRGGNGPSASSPRPTGRAPAASIEPAAAPVSDTSARKLFKSTTNVEDATGASVSAAQKPSLIQRLFGKTEAGMPAREETKAFAKWLKDAHTPKELDNWNFIKQGQINRGRASIEKRQTALNDFIDRTGGSFTKADEVRILKESEVLAKEQKALLDKVGRPHNVVEKIPGETIGGVSIPERYVLKSVKPTAEEIAKDPKWAKLGASGNKSLNTFLKNTEGKVELVVDPVLLRTVGSSAGYVADTKSLVVKSIDTTTAKLESNLNYLHEIRHAKKNLDQNALESKLGRFARNDSDLVGLRDADLRDIATKQGKRLDMDKAEVEEVFTGLKGRRDQAEEFAGNEIDDLERKLSKNQLNGSFHAKDGNSISQFEGYEKYLSLDESTTYARGATQTSRLAEHRMLIEQSLGKDAVPADLAIRSRTAVMQNMVEGADASQRAARENLGLARKGIKDAEAVSSDGTTRIFETATGAELKIKNSGGMLEAEIPLIKHGEEIGTYKVKVPAPEGRRLTDADMLQRLDDGIVKQQGEVAKAAKNAQNGIDKATEVNKKEAAFAGSANEAPLSEAQAPPVRNGNRAPSSTKSESTRDFKKSIDADDAKLPEGIPQNSSGTSLVPAQRSGAEAPRGGAVQPKALDGEILYPAPKKAAAKGAPLEGRVIDGEVISAKISGTAVAPLKAGSVPEVKVIRPDWKTVSAPGMQLASAQSPSSSASGSSVGGARAPASLAGPATAAANGLGKTALLGGASAAALGAGAYGLNQLNAPSAPPAPEDSAAARNPEAKPATTGDAKPPKAKPGAVKKVSAASPKKPPNAGPGVNGGGKGNGGGGNPNDGKGGDGKKPGDQKTPDGAGVDTTGGGVVADAKPEKEGSSMSLPTGLLIGGAVLAAGGAAAYMLTKKKSKKGANLELQAALLAQQQKQAAEASSATATATATENSTATATVTETGSATATSTDTASALSTATATSTNSGNSTATSTATSTAVSGGSIRATNVVPRTFVGATLNPIFVQLVNKDGSRATVSGKAVSVACVEPVPCKLTASPSLVNSVDGKVSFEHLTFGAAYESAVLQFSAEGYPSVKTTPISVTIYSAARDAPTGQVQRGDR